MYIYQTEEIRKIDLRAEENGLDVFTLMENAGAALYKAVTRMTTKDQRIVILAGKGNNGGDGIVLARRLKQNGYNCALVFPGEMPATPASWKHLANFKKCGFAEEDLDGRYDVIIEALHGSGIRLPLRESTAKWLEWANGQDALRIAVDLPAGVSADSGETDPKAYQADCTLCLHGYKPSAFLEGSTDYYGQIEVLDIGLPQTSDWKVWTEEAAAASFQQRDPGAHKGTFGTGLLAAGTDEMPGSALLAALGAVRSGIGKLTVAASPYVSSIIAGRVPECTFSHRALDGLAAGKIPKGIKAAAIGPGLDDPKKIELAVRNLLSLDIPLILDAGALTKREYPKDRKAPVIVTPHPGEFSRMTGESAADIQKNRLCAASGYAVENGVIVLLKGRNTVSAFPDGSLYINQTGNAGLAKGGTGDTLTGILLAFASSYQDIKAACANAVYVHGSAAERWSSSKAQASLLATDVSEELPYILKEFEK